MSIDGEAIYQRLRAGPTRFIEEIHCPMLLNIMGNPKKGTRAAFCVAAYISLAQFDHWRKKHPFFDMVYGLARMIAQDHWEQEGDELKDHVSMPGAQDCRFEVWRMQGWARFGIGKNACIRLDLDPESTPIEHYKQLIKQAGDGAFTAGEFKQLIEGINVGLSAHQVFTMQKEIDQIQSDVKTMGENTNVQNSFTNKELAQKD